MKGMVIGLTTVVAAIAGLVMTMLLLGGGSPRIDASIDNRAHISFAISIVGYIGAIVFTFSFWRTGRNSGTTD